MQSRPVRLDFAQERNAYTPRSGYDEFNTFSKHYGTFCGVCTIVNCAIILFNFNSNDAGSFQKPARGSSSSIFIRGFDKNLDEDTVSSFV